MVDAGETTAAQALKDGVWAFLADRSPWLPLLQHALRGCPEGTAAVLFGGLLRDLALLGTAARPRDVDVVVTGMSEGDLADALQPYVQRRTRFGGWQLELAGVEIDLWLLGSTWGFGPLRVTQPTFADLPRTTFLDIEAIAIGLPLQGYVPGEVYESGFFAALERRTADINLPDNPYPLLSAVRSLNVASRLGFSLGPRLSRFAYEMLRLATDADLTAAHGSAHSNWACPSCLYRSWREQIAYVGPGQVVPPPEIPHNASDRCG